MNTGFSRRFAAIFGIILTVLSTAVVSASVAQAAPMPMGKQNWVVSVAGFRTDAYRNYMRLGYVVFNQNSNAVEHNFWTWNQADFPKPVNSGDVYYCTGGESPNPRNNCAIKTAPGFTGSPNGRFTGTYAYDSAAGRVAINWTSSTINGSSSTVNLDETWAVSELRPGLGRMELVGDSYSITGGIGYGSNAGLDEGSKASMAEVRGTSRGYQLEGQSWNKNTITNQVRDTKVDFTIGPNWNNCNDASCLGYVQYNAGCSAASCCNAGDAACVKRLEDSGNRRFYYMSGDFGGRRNTYEFWCECLSYAGCYLMNSHVKPLLQVIDDSGAFQGWVGTEVSPDRNNNAREPFGEYYSAFALVV